MSNWKTKIIEFVAKLWNIEVQIKPKKLDFSELHSLMVTYDVSQSLDNLLCFYEANNHKSFEKEALLLCVRLQESNKLEEQYYQYKKSIEKSNNKKAKLILGLKILKKDIDTYENYHWGTILKSLVDCELIEEEKAINIYAKIKDIYNKNNETEVINE